MLQGKVVLFQGLLSLTALFCIIQVGVSETRILAELLYSSSTYHVNFRYAVNAFYLHINAHRYWRPFNATE